MSDHHPKNELTKTRGTIGVRRMPDDLDSGRCHLRCGAEAVVRVNLDGIWTSLCDAHRSALRTFLAQPLAAPEPKPADYPVGAYWKGDYE